MVAEVPVESPPDPLELAARLSDRPGLFALVDGVGGGWAEVGRWSFVGCDPVHEIEALLPPAPSRAEPHPLDAILPRWVGRVPYEAVRGGLERLAWRREDLRAPASLAGCRWALHDAVLAIDHRGGRVLAVGEDTAARALARAARRAPPPAPAIRWDVEDVEPPARHVERVAAALEAIRAGEIYQVNLARALRLRRLGAASPTAAAVELARRLLGASPAPFGALWAASDGALVSTSPELLLDARALGEGGFGALRTDPIKGTRPRRPGAARELDGDPKERAELAMIVDVERNDLGRVAAIGSVRVTPPRIVRAGRVLHRVASVLAVARVGLSREEIVRSIVPSGSVTGAPKIRAMEWIADLEPSRRGLYTGGFGLLSRDGSLRLGMAIRTAAFSAEAPSEGEWLVGGGIVEASDPARELLETRWKSAQLSAIAATGAGLDTM